MSAPDPLPETGGVFYRDATGALIPAEAAPAADEAPMPQEPAAPEAEAPTRLKKDRHNA